MSCSQACLDLMLSLFHEPNSQPFSLFEQCNWIKQYFQVPREMQEVVILLVSEASMSIPVNHRQGQADAISQLNDWRDLAHKDDIRLLIRRNWIPFIDVYLPNTAEGQVAYQRAKEIGAIPRQCEIIPKTQSQRYWMKTMHYLWQSKAILIAQALSPPPSDITSENRESIRGSVTDKNWRNIEYIAATDLALYRTLEQDFDYLRQHLPDFSFSTPWQLFCQLLKEDFINSWNIGPESNGAERFGKKEQEEVLKLVD